MLLQANQSQCLLVDEGTTNTRKRWFLFIEHLSCNSIRLIHQLQWICVEHQQQHTIHFIPYSFHHLYSSLSFLHQFVYLHFFLLSNFFVLNTAAHVIGLLWSVCYYFHFLIGNWNHMSYAVMWFYSISKNDKKNILNMKDNALRTEKFQICLNTKTHSRKYNVY